jgi:hypothetical protein
LTGANALFYSGVPGVFLDPTFSTYNVPGVAPGQPAVLQVIAWRGSAPTYEAAAAIDRFCAWNGTTYVPANAFTFINPTGGGGTPPGPPKSLDGMPAMAIYLECVPEPSTAALAVLGMVTLLILRRRYY